MGFAIGGATALTLGFAFGAAAYALVFANWHDDVRSYVRLWRGGIAMGEIGAALGITGVVLLARVVAQRHVRRRPTVVGLAPTYRGASVLLTGRF